MPTLAGSTNNANDPTFQSRVQDAMVQSAIAIYSEANTLSVNLVSGVAITQIVLAVGVSGGLGAGTVLSFATGDTCVVSAAGASNGAQVIPVNSFTPSHTHLIGEPVSPPSPSNHVARANYAVLILNNPAAFVHSFAFALASQGLSQSSIDSDIVNGVASVWNALAGA